MNDWRPIKTAPKDGTWVIIYDPYFVTEMPVSIGTYMTADERDTCGRFKKGEWLLFEWDGMPSSANPTHWMPLPEAPPPPLTDNDPSIRCGDAGPAQPTPPGTQLRR